LKVRDFVNTLKEKYNLSSDEQLAVHLGVTKASIDKWIQRNKVPDKWMLKLGQIEQEDNMSHTQIIIPSQLSFNLSNKEIEILQAYRELEKEDQEIFYHKLKAAAAEARKKAKENHTNNVLQEDVKSAV
jgi:hypothetical protein